MRQPNPPLEPEECPFKIGGRVRVNDTCEYFSDWKDEDCRVTGIQWEYQRGLGERVNLSIATENELSYRYGGADGFRPSELNKQ